MRCTKWNPWWKPNEETLVAIAWISFQDLSPNFFGKEFVFSLARAVGRPLHVDLATQNATRPSCSKVKVEVNLLAKFPQRIKIVEEEEDESGPKEFKWDQGNEKKNEQEKIGTTAPSTKVLSSGKVLGKPVANQAKQEWMQARKNKYQCDKRGYIIDNTRGKEVNNGKGKAKLDALITNNKFNALEVEEDAQPILRITEGKIDDNGNNNEKRKQTGDSTLNPKFTGIKVGESVKELVNSSLINKEARAQNIQNISLDKGEFDARRVKKQAVEFANKEREEAYKGNNLNPTPTGIQSPSGKGNQELTKTSSSNPSEAGIDEETRKESTIEWVHRRFGTRKKELRQLNVTTNHSCHDIPSQTYEDSGQLEDFNEINSAKALWSDQVEVMKDQLGTTNAMKDKEKRDNTQSQKIGSFEDATVNPSSLKSRVLDNSSSKVNQSIPSGGGDRGMLKGPGN
ncbi:uncharacterized protein [Nicotiana tomentosiformis]|uniref:uncharacterized protein n=1 Tax=Nicotiana tomentosiformis TaxID=4098 RepID=UPI00388C6C0E